MIRDRGVKMIIHNVKLEISEGDLQVVIDKNLPEDKKLSDVKVNLNVDKILLSGKYQVPIMGAMGVKINIQPEVRDATTFVLHLNFIGLGGMVTGLILKFLDSKIDNLGFVKREDNYLLVQLDELLKHYKVTGEVDLEEFSVVKGAFILEGKGAFFP